jgi:hypothetical protein
MPTYQLTLNLNKTTGIVGDFFWFNGDYTVNGVGTTALIVIYINGTYYAHLWTDSAGHYLFPYKAEKPGTFNFQTQELNGTATSNIVTITVAPTPPPTETPPTTEEPPKCFIVTALGEDELVMKAREWRDQQGTWFKPINRLYYTISPFIALLIIKHKRIRKIAKKILTPIINNIVGSK